ncbi:MAG: zinc-ribbon domain-containing protein [Anaerolineae bacterium]|jgi:hypothetical protein
MSGGSLLVGAALALVSAAFVARPFRAVRYGSDLEANLERWVAQARAERPVAAGYCHQCGHALDAGDRFCSACGTPVKEPNQ